MPSTGAAPSSTYAAYAELLAAVEDLELWAGGDSLGQLTEWLRVNDGGRPYLTFCRNVTHNDARHTGWPKIRTAHDFAELDAWIIHDTRNAGPKTWAAWAAGLRVMGIEPAWARGLSV